MICAAPPQDALRQNLKASSSPTSDPITAIVATDQLLFVGRTSGTVQRYRLPHCQLEGQYTLRCRPYAMAVNCNATRMSLTDPLGVLSFLDLTGKGGARQHLEYEKKVKGWDWGGFQQRQWNLQWSFSSCPYTSFQPHAINCA